MNPQLLDILCCPVSKMPLRLLRSDELTAINAARSHDDQDHVALTAGLITRDRRMAYRIEDDIPVLLADEAIAIADIAGFPEN
ncbi:MAG: hypothetical protein IT467_03495 [Dokdonella sp.]|uniref:Trm112 family protein n=1 Tax=Dokdonella sp. TaxID=2291710 RepID=UPI0025C0FBB3|nr:Trm112 family protein [Dokdonella sp.]MBZ0223105.1 hypothetical protein [Dokdonella sp.]MCC7254977.1 hypothetical protein [Dokdonella sp.]